MSTIYLRVKINSLTEEAKIIRREEHRRRYQKVKGPDGKIYKRRVVTGDTIFWGLRTHRTEELRLEARATYLAYAFLRGTPYAQVEENPHWKRATRSKHPPSWPRIAELVVKYGPVGHNTKLAKESAEGAIKAWVEGEEVKIAA